MSERPIIPYVVVTAKVAIQCRQPNGQIGSFSLFGRQSADGNFVFTNVHRHRRIIYVGPSK